MSDLSKKFIHKLSALYPMCRALIRLPLHIYKLGRTMLANQLSLHITYKL